MRSIHVNSEQNSNTIQNDVDLIEAICRRGYPASTGSASQLDEISARQGSSLAALLLGGNYYWNFGDGSESICSSDNVIYKIRPGVTIRVLGPPKHRLEQLYKSWITDLRRMGFSGKIDNNGFFDDAFEFLCAFKNLRASLLKEPIALSSLKSRRLEDAYIADNSITNGSSISLLIECGSTRLLFLGDSYSEDIETELSKIPDANFPMEFDVIKVSHHGSLRNTSPKLLKMIDAPVYLISSSGGRHNHPDIEVLKEIVDRPSNFQRHLYFNYITPASQQMHHYSSQSGTPFEIHEGVADWIEITGRDK